MIKVSVIGSVDNGKSSLIGRLLYDTNNYFTDHLEEVKEGSLYNFANLIDGLKKERDLGITVDIAYRSFYSPQRRYTLIDTPGHLEYFKKMVSGLSQSEAVIIIIDAQNGVTEETERYIKLCNFLQLENIIFIINKIDLPESSQKRFLFIKKEINERLIKHTSTHVIPTIAIAGDNIVHRSNKTPWYKGPTVLDTLDTLGGFHEENRSTIINIQHEVTLEDKRTYYLGKVTSGKVSINQKYLLLPENKQITIQEIIKDMSEKTEASVNNIISFKTDMIINHPRSQIITDIKNNLIVSKEINAEIIWFKKNKINTSKHYLKIANNIVSILNIKIKYKKSPNKDICKATIYLKENVIYDNLKYNPVLSRFIIIDEATFDTIAIGIIVEESNEEY